MLSRAAAVTTALALAAGGLVATAAPAVAADGMASISGTISGEAFGETPAASLGTGAQALLLEYSAVDGGWDPVVADQTDTEGRYEFTGLDAGRYSVTFTGFPTSPTVWIPENWENQLFSSFDTALPIELGDGESFIADAALTRAARIGGLITASDTHGELTEDAVDVRLDNVTGGDIPAASFYTLTNGYGEAGWASGALLPGDYKLQFVTDDSTPYLSEWWNGSLTREDATIITLEAGETITDFATELERGDLFITVPTPTISGTAKVGSKLTAKPGNFAPAATDLAYDWQAAGISVGTASTYAPSGADEGKKITVSVTAITPGYKSATGVSKATKVVVGGTTTGVTPKFTGTAKVGTTLTAVPGTWKPASTAFTYKWLRDGKAITDATAATYTLVSTDRGKKIALRVTGTSTGFSSVSKTSAAKTVGYGGLTAGQVWITGTPKAGEILTAHTEAWGPDPVALSYTWKADKKVIKGETGATLEIPGEVWSTTITVSVTGKKPGYSTKTRTSSPTPFIENSIVEWGNYPTVSGGGNVGDTLTTSATGWAPKVNLYFNWTRDGVKISGATKRTYKIQARDRGHAIGVYLLAHRDGYLARQTSSEEYRFVAPKVAYLDISSLKTTVTNGVTTERLLTSPRSVKAIAGESIAVVGTENQFGSNDRTARLRWCEKSLKKCGTGATRQSGGSDILYLEVPATSKLASYKKKAKAGGVFFLEMIVVSDDGIRHEYAVQVTF